VTTQHTPDEQNGAELTAVGQPYASEFAADSTPAEVSPSVSSTTPEEQAPSDSFYASATSAADTQEVALIEDTSDTRPTPSTDIAASSTSEEAALSVPTIEATTPPAEQPSAQDMPTPTCETVEAADSSAATAATETTTSAAFENIEIISAAQDISPASAEQDQPQEAIPHEANAAVALVSNVDVAENMPILSAVHVEETVSFTAPDEPSATVVSEDAPDVKAAEKSVALQVGHQERANDLSLLAATEEEKSELPPFTAFIEEFRQAEARENAAEPFSLFPEIRATSFEAAHPSGLASADEQPSTEMKETGSAIGTTAEQTPADTLTDQKEAGEQQSGPTRFRFTRSTTTGASPSAGSAEENAAATGTESPRPTRRYRFDRPATTNGGGASATGNAIVPPTSIPSTPLAKRSEESKESKEPVARNGHTINTNVHNGHATHNGQTNQHAAASVEKPEALPVAEAPAVVPPTQIAQAQLTSTTPEVNGTETHASTNGEPERRRRHGQREKEQPAATTTTPTPSTPIIPAQEPVAPVTEQTPPMIEEIAPEDLPPLEYADLQKTTSRRRRRHRSSAATTPTVSANGTTPTPLTDVNKPDAPTTQGTPSTPTMPTPLSTPTTGKNNGQSFPTYSIVSGYTVNQMNQGTDHNGPFMGPEPSPARGSILTRDGRTMRAETQRTPIYPSRTGGESASVNSIQQLASVLSQSIQMQTDRMVAELRRANQAPTNVSVSIPPFPSTERVGVFVDVANLLYSARTMRISIDFGKLLDFLRGNRRLVRAHAYCPTSPQAGDEQMFLQAVKGLGYRITTKNYKTFASGAKKADLDLDLCMDVVRLVEGRAVDCIVLVSGDSDFMPMLDYCSDHGVRVEVAAFDEAMSATLRQSCDLFINLSMLEDIRS
jgi:uncharacterized LabA/DUF88 family protein